MSIGKALTVDDSPAIRAVIKIVLEAAGFEVLEADSVQAAMEILGFCRVDVIVTDMNMPGESGLGLIRRMGRQPPRRRVPVLVVSSESNPALRALSLRDGAIDWLAKPIDPSRLIRAVTDASARTGRCGRVAAQARRRTPRARHEAVALGA